MDGYRHYIRTDANGIVIKGFTSAFLKGANGDEEILPGDLELQGYDTRQFQINLVTDDERRQNKYKVVNGTMVARTQQELDVEWDARPPQPKTELERIREENQQLNNQIIDLWETLLSAGVL